MLSASRDRFRRHLSAALLVIACTSLAPTLTSGQSVTDPRIVQFDPSTDHATILSDGRPAVDHYELGFYAVGASQPFQVLGLGKPIPGSNGTIQVDFVNLLASWPPPGVVYESRVAAIGPAGIALSSPSNTFNFSGGCGYAVSNPPPASTAASGTSGVVNVASGAGCAWSASSTVTWVTLNSSGGIGNSSVSFTVAPNVATSSRAGSLTIAGQMFTITQSGAAPPTPQIVILGTQSDLPAAADYDGDGKTDPAVFGKASAVWKIRRSSDGLTFSLQFGAPSLGDTPVPADFDGDGKADIAIFRRKTGQWFVRRSSDLGITQVTWGVANDAPVPGDYDGDGRADFAVFRSPGGQWIIRRSSDGGTASIQWGAPSLKDAPVLADYDGDHKTDIGVYRGSTGAWYIRRSSDAGLQSLAWGAPAKGDVPVPADYDGDGKADVAVFRKQTAQWLIANSLGTTTVTVWGVSSDLPVPGLYAGAPATRIAVWRPSTGAWRW